MCFSLNLVVIFLISLFLVLFSFADFFFFLSHLQLCFLIIFASLFFAGVAEDGEFLKQCEILQVAKFRNLRIFSQVAKFRNLRIFAQVAKFRLRIVHLLPTLSIPCNLLFPTLH